MLQGKFVLNLSRVLARPRRFPRSCLYHLRLKQPFHPVAQYSHGTRSTAADDPDNLSYNESVDQYEVLLKASWEDTANVLDLAYDPSLDEPLGIEDVNVVSETKPGDRTGDSGKKRARIQAAVAKSQVHKRNKAGKREARASIKSASADWRSLFKLLQEETGIESVDQNQDVAPHTPSSTGSPIREIAADQIPRPKKWTVVSFGDYVQSLASSSVAPLRQRRLYNDLEGHVPAVADILEELFQEDSLVPYWSVRACNNALKFFYKHGMIPRVRALFFRMDTHRFITSTVTFNIMLRTMAEEKNLSEFKSLLLSMIRRKLKPDVDTWQAFFLLNSGHARYSIFVSMLERGILADSRSMGKFFALNTRQILCAALDKGHSIEWLLAYLDKQAEFFWLSTVVGNTIIDEAGKRGRALDALGMLDQLLERGMEPNTMTLCILLHRCIPGKNTHLSIQVLHKLAPEMVRLDKTAYDALFIQYWRCKNYNCAKVVWRFACLEGQTSARVLRLVSKSIARKPPPSEAPTTEEALSRTEAWRQRAGKMILGRGFGGSETALQMRIQMSVRMPSESFELTGDPWFALFDHDLATAHRYEAVRSLPDLLDEALVKDREWEANQYWRHKPLSWMWENSIRVPLLPTDTDSALSAPRMKPPFGSIKRLPLKKKDTSNDAR